MLPSTAYPESLAFLEYFSERNKSLRRVKLNPLPFRIGRSSGTHLLIPFSEVSKVHCQIHREGTAFVIRDMGSTNGTFLNGQRITQAVLKTDDLIHIAHEEFRFLWISLSEPHGSENPMTVPVRGEVPASVIRGSQYLQEMLTEEWGRVLFQPIVQLGSNDVIGYEGLGRGLHNNLNVNPSALFDLADQCGLAVPLSRMFLRMAVQDANLLPPVRHVFLNLHPSEVHCPGLAEALGKIVAECTLPCKFVVEINEKAVVDLASLRTLRDQFKEIGLQVAYDDFGAGQARFLELADLPPDFVKLDMGLIRDLHLNGSRQNLVKAITRASKELGVKVIAEGIETQEEADICQSLDCTFGQGFLFGRPQTAGLSNSMAVPCP